jgi:long-subunit fatty acid transport protein
VGYNIDVYKIVPYMGLWLVGLRVDQLATIQNASGDAFTKAQVAQLGYDLGGRVSLGVDYDITPHITIGAALAYDWFFTAATGYANRLLLVARAAYRFGTPRPR